MTATRPLNVAVMAHSFPRFPGDTHGPFVKRLSEEIAGLGHRVHVLVPWDPELRDDPSSPLTIHSFRYVWPPSWHLLGYSRTLRRDVGMKLAAWLLSPLYFARGQQALTRLVREEGIELIHAHWLLPNGYIASRVSRATGVPFAATLHGSDIFMAERAAPFGRMAATALSGASHITSCSADLQQRLLRLGGEEFAAKVPLVPNGTDLAPADQAGDEVRRRFGAGPGEPLVAAVGRLVYKKGFRYLLAAAPEIFERHPSARLVIGGGGELADELQHQVRELGIAERVSFPGMLSHDQVLELVAAADLFVMPSIRDPGGNIDGLPIVVLEAMAAGRPVVATDVAGMPLAVADGETGTLVPEKDPAALAAAVGQLLADGELRRRMGAAGRRRVEEELNWRAVARLHDRLYQQAVTAP
jgi:glycosyltransferase involved in cell wall biosynthesis